MANDAPAPPAPEAATEAAHPTVPVDQANLDPYRVQAQGAAGKVDAAAAKHLTKLEIAEESAEPFNPRKQPGTYDPEDVEFAKKRFDPVEVLQFEEQGPKNFHWLMDRLRKNDHKFFINAAKSAVTPHRTEFLQKYFPGETT